MKKNARNNVTVKVMALRSLLGAVLAFCMFQYWGFYSQANVGNIGQNISNWFLEQMFWIVLIIIILVCVGLYSKRAYMQMVIVGVAGAVMLYFIKNPTMLQTIGDGFVKIIFR